MSSEPACRLLVLALLLAPQPWAQVRVAVRPPLKRFQATQAPATAAQLQLARKNCGQHGVPKLSPLENFGPTTILYREGYVLEHSTTDRIALWVCETFDRTQWDPPSDRADKFRPDPDLKPGQRAELADYKGTKLDRGHLAPAADFRDEHLKADSFFLSNMAPQSPKLNQNFWRRLEDEIRHWSTATSPITVFTGGFFYDPKEDNPATATGQILFRRIGKNAVAVPTHFYKVVVRGSTPQTLEAVGFVVENVPAPAGAKFENAIRSLAWIEEHTGITFMPGLDPETRDRLKSQPGKPLL